MNYYWRRSDSQCELADLSDSECGSVLPPVYSRLQSRLNPVPESLNSPDIVPGECTPVLRIPIRNCWAKRNQAVFRIRYPGRYKTQIREGSKINISDHISESFVTIFWVKTT